MMQMMPARDQKPLGHPPFRRSKWPDSSRYTDAYRIDNRYLMRFPDVADFEISADGSWSICCPVLGVSEATINQLYLNHVLPHLLSQQGKLVFHASAVYVDGGTIVFMGDSGLGKSTLAAHFALKGYPFLTDDCLLVEGNAGAYTAIPSHPSIRLWDDSQEWLGIADTAKAPPVDFTPKERVLATPKLPYCQDPRPIRLVYCLGDACATRATLTRLTEAEAFRYLFKRSFLLETEAPEFVQRHFHSVATFANSVKCFTLDYPRCYDELEHVRAALIAHTGIESSAR